MDFLSSGFWWAYMMATAILFAIFLGTRLKIPGYGWMKLIVGNLTGWGTFALIVAAFFILGWRAGLGILVGTNIIYALAASYARLLQHRASAAG